MDGSQQIKENVPNTNPGYKEYTIYGLARAVDTDKVGLVLLGYSFIESLL